jgi:hypothetical protein
MALVLPLALHTAQSIKSPGLLDCLDSLVPGNASGRAYERIEARLCIPSIFLFAL